MPKANCGSITARKGGRLPLMANTVVIFMKTMKAKAMVMPMAKCRPMPPLTFLDDTATPMKVITIIAKGFSMRCHNSIDDCTTVVEPRILSCCI